MVRPKSTSSTARAARARSRLTGSPEEKPLSSAEASTYSVVARIVGRYTATLSSTSKLDGSQIHPPQMQSRSVLGERGRADFSPPERLSLTGWDKRTPSYLIPQRLKQVLADFLAQLESNDVSVPASAQIPHTGRTSHIHFYNAQAYVTVGGDRLSCLNSQSLKRDISAITTGVKVLSVSVGPSQPNRQRTRYTLIAAPLSTKHLFNSSRLTTRCFGKPNLDDYRSARAYATILSGATSSSLTACAFSPAGDASACERLWSD
jgi:hypothetical protein